MRKKKRRKSDKTIVVCLFIFFACCLGILFYYNKYRFIEKRTIKKDNIKIVNMNSKKRPIAVMIDNNVGYDKHFGLQDSYLNYEIIVEGGLTRIMSIYKDNDVDKIGPIRSSRHYFLDYALENDAIYTHFGWSPYAQNDIKTLNVSNINGLYDDYYWRDSNLKAPHNVYTSTNKIYEMANKKDYSLLSNNWKIFKYSPKEIAFNSDDSILANELVIKYSNYQTTSYKYDTNSKYYLRFMDKKEHIDAVTKKQLHYKNIIIEFVNNSTIDSDGRQDLDTTSNGDGYFVTNGYAKKITWEKNSRKNKTRYTYEDGNEVILNDGNTFIQIVPLTVEPIFN